jgi:hypothetical protein
VPLYHRHVIPYTLHVKQSSGTAAATATTAHSSPGPPVYCSLIHQNDPLPSPASVSEGEENDTAAKLWTEEDEVMIRTKSTRQCLQLLLSQRLNVCLLSPSQGTAPPNKVHPPPPPLSLEPSIFSLLCSALSDTTTGFQTLCGVCNRQLLFLSTRAATTTTAHSLPRLLGISSPLFSFPSLPSPSSSFSHLFLSPCSLWCVGFVMCDQHAKQLLRSGDTLTLLFPKKRSSHSQSQSESDPHLLSLLALYRQHGHDLQVPSQSPSPPS